MPLCPLVVSGLMVEAEAGQARGHWPKDDSQPSDTRAGKQPCEGCSVCGSALERLPTAGRFLATRGDNGPAASLVAQGCIKQAAVVPLDGLRVEGYAHCVT